MFFFSLLQFFFVLYISRFEKKMEFKDGEFFRKTDPIIRWLRLLEKLPASPVLDRLNAQIRQQAIELVASNTGAWKDKDRLKTSAGNFASLSAYLFSACQSENEFELKQQFERKTQEIWENQPDLTELNTEVNAFSQLVVKMIKEILPPEQAPRE